MVAVFLEFLVLVWARVNVVSLVFFEVLRLESEESEEGRNEEGGAEDDKHANEEGGAEEI